MVLSSIVTSMMHKFCHRWVKNFQKENLHISTMSGTICMDDFEIVTTEIQELQLPIEIKKFSVGKLALTVPYAHLMTRSVEFEIADVFILLGTPQNPEWDPKSLVIAEQTKIYLLQQLVTMIEKSAKSKKVSNRPFKPTPIIMSILKNLLLDVRRIHIRFEDSQSGRDAERPCQFAGGLKLHSFRVEPSTSVSAPPCSRTNSKLRDSYAKDVQMKHFSIYFRDDEMFESSDNVQQRFLDSFKENTRKFDALDVLEPATVSAKIIVRISEHSFPAPETVDVQVHCPEVSLNICSEHYRYIVCLLDEIDRFDRFSMYRRFRPTSMPKRGKDGKWVGSWREWWHYAITCTLVDIMDPYNGKVSWKKTMNLALVGVQYIGIRQAVRPYIVRNKFKSSSGEEFTRLRENFKGVQDDYIIIKNILFSQNAIFESGRFGNAVMSGIYGFQHDSKKLKNIQVTLLPDSDEEEIESENSNETRDVSQDHFYTDSTGNRANPVDQDTKEKHHHNLLNNAAHAVSDGIKHLSLNGRKQKQLEKREKARLLWLRQLSIEASFRPIIIAKLRYLAEEMCLVKEKKKRQAEKQHNIFKGVMTISVLSVDGLSSKMNPFFKLKVGQTGKAYKGTVLTKNVALNSFSKSSSTGGSRFLVSQTYEFRLNGVSTEDYLFLDCYDRFPVYDQTFGHAKYALTQLNDFQDSTLENSGYVAIDLISTEKKKVGVIHANVFFHPSAKHERGPKTSRCFAEVLLPDYSIPLPSSAESSDTHHKEHEWYSWYGEEKQSMVKEIHYWFLLDRFRLSLSIPYLSEIPSIQDIKKQVEVVVSNFDFSVHQLFEASSKFKSKFIIGSVQVMQFDYSGTRDYVHTLVRGPKSDDSKLLIQETTMNGDKPKESSSWTGDIEVCIDLKQATQMLHRIVFALPEISRLYSLYASPYYKAILSQTLTLTTKETRQIIENFIDNFFLQMKVVCEPIDVLVVNPLVENEVENLLEWTFPANIISVSTNDLGMEMYNNGTRVCKISKNSSEFMSVIQQIATLLMNQWRKRTGDYHNVDLYSRHKVLALQLQVDQLQATLASTRRKVHQYLEKPGEHAIKTGDVVYLKRILNEVSSSKPQSQAPISKSLSSHDPFIACLKQGITVMKHHKNNGNPSWRIMWISPDCTTLYVSEDRNLSKFVSGKSMFLFREIGEIVQGCHGKALGRTGIEINAMKYCTIFTKKEGTSTATTNTISFEFREEWICKECVEALKTLRRDHVLKAL